MLRKKLLTMIKFPVRYPLVILSLSWVALWLLILGRKLNEAKPKAYHTTASVERPRDTFASMQDTKKFKIPTGYVGMSGDLLFKRQWLRMLRARVDWKAILAPCLGNTEWNKTNPGWGKANETSAEKSFLDFMDIRPAGQFSRIFIQTRTKDGKNKTIGGDFWKVTMSGPARITATIFDHGNGTYEALVLFLDPGTYNVDVFLERSLCQGFKDPPQNWFRLGDAHGKYQPKDVFGPLDDYVFAPLQGGKNITIQIFSSDDVNKGLRASSKISCPESCRLIWNGYGRWVGNSWIPFFRSENRVYDLQDVFQKRKSKAEGSLYVIGDSLSRDFALEYFKRYELCKVRFKFCETLFLSTYPRWDRDKIPKLHNWDDFRPKIVLDGISNVFRKPDMRNNSSMLVINFAVHFARALNFTTYQDLIENFVSLVKNRKKLFGSNARVVWKTTTETHFLSVFGRADGRFLTSTRVRLFAAYALSAMCKAGIEILDVYPTSASTLEGRKDNFHYHENVFSKAMDTLAWHSLKDPETKSQDVCVGW